MDCIPQLRHARNRFAVTGKECHRYINCTRANLAILMHPRQYQVIIPKARSPGADPVHPQHALSVTCRGNDSQPRQHDHQSMAPQKMPPTISSVRYHGGVSQASPASTARKDSTVVGLVNVNRNVEADRSRRYRVYRRPGTAANGVIPHAQTD